ncbi:hypothetical protein JXA85_03620 [Candidatus Woesearchaeota archaeon]|nr:hypothetical protein [Candidatus Woesearchaeota archaeon]
MKTLFLLLALVSSSAQWEMEIREVDSSREPHSVPRSITDLIVFQGHMFVAMEGGVFCFDGKWKDTGLGKGKEIIVTSLEVFQGKLFAATFGDGLFQFQSDGKEWREIYIKEKWIWAVCATSDSSLYLATNNGVVKSDNGNSWNTFNKGLVNSFLVISVLNFAFDHEQLYAGTHHGLFRLENKTWVPTGKINFLGDPKQYLRPKQNASVRCIAVYGDTVFVGTFESGIFRSIDSGKTWDNLALTDISGCVNDIAYYKGNIIAATEEGLFCTSGSGGLRQLGPKTPINCICIPGSHKENLLYAGSRRGVLFIYSF